MTSGSIRRCDGGARVVRNALRRGQDARVRAPAQSRSETRRVSHSSAANRQRGPTDPGPQARSLPGAIPGCRIRVLAGALANSVRDDYASSMGARNPFESGPVRSRRGGPAKRPLSRDAIVTEALQQLTSHGIEGMSLREVAAALEGSANGCHRGTDRCARTHGACRTEAPSGVTGR